MTVSSETASAVHIGPVLEEDKPLSACSVEDVVDDVAIGKISDETVGVIYDWEPANAILGKCFHCIADGVGFLEILHVFHHDVFH